MLSVTYRKGGLRIASIWFAQNRDIMFEKKCDIAIYHQVFKWDKSKKDCSIFNTLNTDLLYSEEDIMSRFRKSIRYQIRRAERDGVETVFYNSKDLSEDSSIITAFCKVYNQFLKSKKLKGKCNRNAINAYVKENAFFISCARHKDSKLVYHAYVGDGNRARLLYSASLFRLSEDNTEKALIGNANRLLHWNDILMFKKMEYHTYDWGGCSSKYDVSNIAEFKKGFGGDITKMYNSHVSCSLLGNAVLTIKNSLDYFKTMISHKGAS